MALRLRSIDDNTKYLVSGFIKQSQSLLPFEVSPYYNLTELIVQICLIYYAITEYWNILDSHFITQQYGTVLKRKILNGWRNTNYGKMVIPSIGNLIYEWHLKINKVRQGAAFIGIADANKVDTGYGFRWSTKVANYCWYGDAGQLSYRFNHTTKEGTRFRSGDIIVIKVDTMNGFVEFYKGRNSAKNSTKFDLEQKDVLSYRIAVTMFNGSNYITLIRFNITRAET